MKKFLLWGIPTVVLLALVGWRFATRDPKADGPGGGRGRGGGPAVVQVATVQVRPMTSELQTVGDVISPFAVEISPKNSGRIEFLTLREGDPVTKGQVLLKIDPSDLQGAVAAAQANVAEARSRLAQAKMTQGSTNVGLATQVKQQQAGVAGAKADLGQMQSNYEAQVAQARAQLSSAQAAARNAQASLDKERASLGNAQAKYDRTFGLYKQGFIAAQDVDDAKTALAVQQGAVAVAEGQVAAAKAQVDVQQQNLGIVQRKGKADIADSQAKMDQAKASLQAAKANRAQGPAYKENLAALGASVDAAIAQLQQAQSRLRDTVVRSPIQGVVTARKANVGDLASPGAAVLEVQFLDWLYVTASVPVEDSATVRVGQTAVVTFDALPGKTFRAPIEHVNLAADPTSRQFAIRVKLNNSGHALRPGMYARVTIETRYIPKAITIPREALTDHPGGEPTVAVVGSDSTAKIRKVELGMSDDQGFQVLSGVTPGERVVILAASPVRDGQKLTIQGAAKPKAGKRP